MSGDSTLGAVLISGPTSGLGLELLRAFVTLSRPLILIGRDLCRVHGLLSVAPCFVQTIECDLAELFDSRAADQLEGAVFDAMKKTRSQRFVFVSNAGVVSPIGQVGDIFPSTLAATFSVNVLAPAAISSGAVKYAKSSGATLNVLNVSSGAAVRPLPGWGAYCATKAAARMLFDVMEQEQQAQLCLKHFDPGVIDTKMQREIRAATTDQFPLAGQFQKLSIEGALQKPAEVAERLVTCIEAWINQ